MSVLETKYKDNMSENEAVELVREAIEAGIFHDLGSGSNVDIYVVRRTTCEKKESYRVFNQKKESTETFKFSKGQTPVLEDIEYKWKNIQVTEENIPMDIY